MVFAISDPNYYLRHLKPQLFRNPNPLNYQPNLLGGSNKVPPPLPFIRAQHAVACVFARRLANGCFLR